MSEDEIDRNLAETFPASDPPSWTLGTDHRDESPDNKADDEKRSESTKSATRWYRRLIRVAVGSSGDVWNPGIELDRSLKMFFGQLVHSEVLQSEADHPMVKRIVGSELVGLFFVSDRFCGSCPATLRRRRVDYWPGQVAHFAARHRSKLKWLLPCGPAARAIRLFPGERESNRRRSAKASSRLVRACS